MVHRVSPHLACRCVLLSGPAGSGKTTVCRLGYRAMVAAWGHPAAAIDTDQLYLNVDARWELPYDDARNAMVLAQATHLAISLFEHGWQTVIICGNSLFDPTDTAPVLSRLCPVAEVYHVTLTPALPTVLTRCAGTPGRDPSRLTADVELLARKPHPGSAHLDNSNMTPEQTLTELARLADTGAGRLNCPP
jgi:DNA polymerase III delta prime subunit